MVASLSRINFLSRWKKKREKERNSTQPNVLDSNCIVTSSKQYNLYGSWRNRRLLQSSLLCCSLSTRYFHVRSLRTKQLPHFEIQGRFRTLTEIFFLSSYRGVCWQIDRQAPDWAFQNFRDSTIFVDRRLWTTESSSIKWHCSSRFAKGSVGGSGGSGGGRRPLLMALIWTVHTN